MTIQPEQVEPFKDWLSEQGAEVQLPTNEYEVVRFRTVNGTSVIYEGKRGQSFMGESGEAFRAFQEKKRWVTQDRNRKNYRHLMAKLELRDGQQCFWCWEPYEDLGKMTVEHILNRMHGGNNNTYNLSLACEDCQKKLGNMPITQKIRLRDELIKEKARQSVLSPHKPDGLMDAEYHVHSIPTPPFERRFSLRKLFKRKEKV